MRASLLCSFLTTKVLPLCILLLLLTATARGQVLLQEPSAATPWWSQENIRMIFTLSPPYAAAGKVRVRVSDGTDSVTSNEIQAAAGTFSLTVNLFKGNNTITVIGFNAAGALPTPIQTWPVSCSGQWCKDPFSLTPGSVVSVMGPAPAAPPAPVASGIKFDSQPNLIVQDETFLQFKIKVTKPTINQVFVRILNKGKPIPQQQELLPVDRNQDGTAKTVKTTIRVGPGKNEISAFDPGANAAATDIDTVVVQCDGESCGTESDVASIVTNSQNTRIVVGMEQAGASSTTSETKPFLDFFFTGPFVFNSRVPRLATWGQIRFNSTPDQITNTGVLPTNLVNQVGSASSGSLVQSFDFVAGLEGRVFTSNGYFLSLIPGIRQKTRFYLAGGWGAISPLTVNRDATRTFRIPKPDESQFDLFVARYGMPPEGKEFVAFVPLDRDRFLRQWYAGLRLKTYYCEDQECTRFRNSFPGTLDVMFGQNEAVTGGSRKYGGTPDPNDNTRIIGEKNAYVVRIDGFYPLPFRETRFLYLHGTAMMKVGGGRTKVLNPLFLDPATVLITDPKVFIPPPDLQQLLQPNRDYYKIGVGINLTDLFNRSRTP
jgi:hypothetical protein